MSGDRWPNEPDDPGKDEFDPLEDIGPDVPEVDVPDAPDPSENDVDPKVARSFWRLVATFNLAMFALALGPMLAFFRGDLVDGALVFCIGLGAALYGYRGYRRAKADIGDESTIDADDHNG